MSSSARTYQLWLLKSQKQGRIWRIEPIDEATGELAGNPSFWRHVRITSPSWTATWTNGEARVRYVIRTRALLEGKQTAPDGGEEARLVPPGPAE